MGKLLAHIYMAISDQWIYSSDLHLVFKSTGENFDLQMARFLERNHSLRLKDNYLVIRDDTGRGQATLRAHKGVAETSRVCHVEAWAKLWKLPTCLAHASTIKAFHSDFTHLTVEISSRLSETYSKLHYLSTSLYKTFYKSCLFLYPVLL